MSKGIIDNTSFIDLSSKDNGHLVFNLSILYEYKTRINNNFIFFCFPSNIDIINWCKELEIQNVVLKEPNNYLLRTLINFYRTVVCEKSKKIVLLAIDNSLIPFLFLINSIFIILARKKITIILHNNLETLYRVKWKRLMFKIFLKIFNPKLITLSPFIQKELHKCLNYSNIPIVFHQNYIDLFNDVFKFKLRRNNEERIIISISSSHSRILIKELSQNKSFFGNQIKHLEDRIRINYISMDTFDAKYIFLIKNMRPNDIYDYYQYIYNSDYMLFPIDNSSNKRASGVLMDTLTLGVGFIAPNVGHFKDIKKNFNIGILYDDYSNLIEILCNLKKNNFCTNSNLISNTSSLKLLQTLINE